MHGLDGALVGDAPLGNRKDIRNAVEAARAAAATSGPRPPRTDARRSSISSPKTSSSGATRSSRKLAAFVGPEQAAIELDYAVERTFTYAAWADKFEGSVHNPPFRMVTLAMKEAIGTVGILAPDEAPLLGLLSLVLPAIAWATPSSRCPASARPR